jgi:hypothetical protein
MQLLILRLGIHRYVKQDTASFNVLADYNSSKLRTTLRGEVFACNHLRLLAATFDLSGAAGERVPKYARRCIA